MVFLQTAKETNGGLLRNESFNPPAADAEPEHTHPFQESGAEVISGSVRFRVGAEERSLKAGESITIPANTPHFFWNDGDEEAHFIGWFRPALKIERFFESFFGLAQDGKLNEKGLPSMLQLAVMVPHFGEEIRLISPPWAVQRATFGMLVPIAKVLGYRPEYPYPYGDRSDKPLRQRERKHRRVRERVGALWLRSSSSPSSSSWRLCCCGSADAGEADKGRYRSGLPLFTQRRSRVLREVRLNGVLGSSRGTAISKGRGMSVRWRPWRGSALWLLGRRA